VKCEISVTIDQSLIKFLGSLPGDSRSGKIESAARKIKKLADERDLRMQLAGYREADAESVERELWENTIAEAMWTQ
jgi:hypothetical protein